MVLPLLPSIIIYYYLVVVMLFWVWVLALLVRGPCSGDIALLGETVELTTYRKMES
jgi:hypothetical protein